MDTEKYIQLENKIDAGKSLSDEGPYYHHAFWESYKGAVKGKLLGVAIGGMIGMIMGAAVLIAAASFPALGLAGLLGGGVSLGVLGAFTAAGATYAVHEFSAVGRTVGGSSAQFYQQELREKAFMKGQVAEIKEEINEVKSLVKGEPIKKDSENQKSMALADEEEGNYRKSHYAKLSNHKFNSVAFWKVLVLGAAVGSAIGFVLATGGVAAPILEHVIGHEVVAGLISSGGLTAASTITMGALGASFGLNRDFFRRVADRTDMLLKGRFKKRDHDAILDEQIESGKIFNKKINKYHEEDTSLSALAENSGIKYPESDTHFRDKVMPAAQRALLSFDHTRATPQ